MFIVYFTAWNYTSLVRFHTFLPCHIICALSLFNSSSQELIKENVLDLQLHEYHQKDYVIQVMFIFYR